MRTQTTRTTSSQKHPATMETPHPTMTQGAQVHQTTLCTVPSLTRPLSQLQCIGCPVYMVLPHIRDRIPYQSGQKSVKTCRRVGGYWWIETLNLVREKGVVRWQCHQWGRHRGENRFDWYSRACLVFLPTRQCEEIVRLALHPLVAASYSLFFNQTASQDLPLSEMVPRDMRCLTNMLALSAT